MSHEATPEERSLPDLGQLALGDDEDEEMEDLEGQQLAEMTALLQDLRARGLDPDMLVQPSLNSGLTRSPNNYGPVQSSMQAVDKAESPVHMRPTAADELCGLHGLSAYASATCIWDAGSSCKLLP